MRIGKPNPTALPVVSGTDLISPSFYARGDPHAVWATLRDECPVYWQGNAAHGGFWIVTRHRDVCDVLSDHRRFTSEGGTMLSVLHTEDVGAGRMMAATDPPRHTQLREAIGRTLDRRVVESQGAQIRAAVRELLAPAAWHEPWDIGAAAMLFPMAITGTMMGLPRADWSALARLTTASIAPDDPEFRDGDPSATARRAHHELLAYFADAARGRSRSSGDRSDMIAHLVRMDAGGRRLTEEEVVLNCYSLLLGANGTTPHALCCLFMLLAESPALLESLATSRRPADLQSTVEEALRWSSPTMHFMRYATRDLTLAGTPIGAGDAVTAWLGSANRDRDVFADPYRFDAVRRPNRHVAFGRGPHYCVGAALARAALVDLLGELVATVRAVTVAGPVQHLSSNVIAGIKHLPVRLELRPGEDRPA
jgi:cytochrome P450